MRICLEAWGVRHLVTVSIRYPEQEVGIASGCWRFQMTLWNGREPIGSVAGRGDSRCWTTTPPRELCGRKKLEHKIVGINPLIKVVACANRYGMESTSES